MSDWSGLAECLGLRLVLSVCLWRRKCETMYTCGLVCDKAEDRSLIQNLRLPDMLMRPEEVVASLVAEVDAFGS